MWVFCHRDHRVEDKAIHSLHLMKSGQAYDLREELARQVTAEFPSRLCLIPDGQDPQRHTCKLTREVQLEHARAVRKAHRGEDTLDEMVGEPPEDKQVRLSPQRRKLLRQAQGRSRRARLATRDTS